MSMEHVLDLPVVSALFVPPLLYAAYSDARFFRLPNWLSGLIAALFLPAALLSPHPVDWLSHLGAALVFGGLAAIPFAFRAMGGGDVKLLAAVGLWLGFAPWLVFLTWLCVGCFILLVILLPARALLGWQLGAGRAAAPVVINLPTAFQKQAPVPFGIAISFGAIATWFTQSSTFWSL